MYDRITVAHIDKSATFRQALSLALQETEDIKVPAALSTGPQQLEAVEKLQPDVIVFDVGMPLAGAIEFCGLLHHRFPAIPKIIYTFYEEPFIVRRLMEMEIEGYIVKSGTNQELIESIRAVHRGGTAYGRCCHRFVVGRRRKPLAFTDTELQVLRLICLDWSTEQIAHHLNKTESCITGYRQSLRAKSGTTSVAGLIIFAIANGLISWEEMEKTVRGLL